MTWKSTLSIKNRTTEKATKISCSSENMDEWEFPDNIDSNQTVNIPFSYQESMWHSPDQDKGNVSYAFPNGVVFSIQAFVAEECFLKISLDSTSSNVIVSPSGDLVVKRNSTETIEIIEVVDGKNSNKSKKQH